MRIDPLYAYAVALALVGLFMPSGLTKLFAIRDFRRTVADYQLIPTSLLLPATLLILAAELLAVLLVLLGLAGLAPSLPLGMMIITGLLLLYAAAIGYNVARGRRSIDCGCLGFGARRPGIGWPLVVRNLMLAALAITAALPIGARILSTIDWISMIGFPLIFCLTYVGTNMALQLPARSAGRA